MPGVQIWTRSLRGPLRAYRVLYVLSPCIAPCVTSLTGSQRDPTDTARIVSAQGHVSKRGTDHAQEQCVSCAPDQQYSRSYF